MTMTHLVFVSFCCCLCITFFSTLSVVSSSPSLAFSSTFASLLPLIDKNEENAVANLSASGYTQAAYLTDINNDSINELTITQVSKLET